jgi:hypothetical protein
MENLTQTQPDGKQLFLRQCCGQYKKPTEFCNHKSLKQVLINEKGEIIIKETQN